MSSRRQKKPEDTRQQTLNIVASVPDRMSYISVQETPAWVHVLRFSALLEIMVETLFKQLHVCYDFMLKCDKMNNECRP